MAHLSLGVGVTATDYLQGYQEVFCRNSVMGHMGHISTLFSTCAKQMALNIQDVTRLRVGGEYLC